MVGLETGRRVDCRAIPRNGKLTPHSPAPHPEETTGFDTAVVRPLAFHTEYEAAVVLQEKIWGADVGETVPACMLQVAQEVGGIAEGAFTPDGVLVGLVFGLTGLRDGKLAHWSHILAVEEAWRDRGIGRLLKKQQCEKLLEMGVDSMLWTFDPLESRNAHLNLNILGATVEVYVPDFYGTNVAAKTDTVIGTDRFIVRWLLASPRSASGDVGLALSDIPCVSVQLPLRGLSHPSEPPLATDRFVRVEIPANIQELKLSDPAASVAWRETTRRAFVHYLDAGYRVAEFRPGSEECRGFYILEAS